MFRKLFLCALASAAMIPAAALAQHGPPGGVGGGMGGPPSGMGGPGNAGGFGMGGPGGFGGISDMGSTMRDQGRMNSQGPVHASATGIAHANSNSVLSGAGTRTPLTGVSVGMPLFSNGTQVGTVYRVVTANGVITRVLVQGTNGRIYSFAPNTLTASGGSLTTTATLRG
jgi:hypothetical protein